MADTALIDLLSHANNAATSASSAKSPASNSVNFAKSSNFAEIFNTATKTYSANTNSFSNQYKTAGIQSFNSSKHSNSASTAKNTTTSTTATSDKATDANTVNRKNSDSKNHSQDDSKNVSQNNSKSNSSTENKVEDNTNKINTNDTSDTSDTSDTKAIDKTTTDTANKTDSTDNANSTDNISSADTTAQEKVVIDNAENAQAAIQAVTEEISIPVEQVATPMVKAEVPAENSNNTADNAAVKPATNIMTDKSDDVSAVKKDSQPTQSTSDTPEVPKIDPSSTADNIIINALVQNTPVADLTNNTAAANSVGSANINQDAQVTQAVQTNVEANLFDATKNLNNLTNQANVVKSQSTPQVQIQASTQAQSQAQQVSSDTAASQAKQATQTEAVPTPAVAVQEVDIQVPAIAVDTEELASVVNVKSDSTDSKDVDAKQNVKNILDKASLNQDVVDKTNAKIISVENSNLSDANKDANSHSNLRKQNTEDQIAKLAVENNSTTTSNANVNTATNLSSIATDTTPQTNFAKALSNVQTQPQQPTSKDVSDTEILSQINNKLTSFKDDGTSKVSIVLRPENLGKINLELVNTKEGLTAQLTTDNPQVKQILDKSIDSLKENLSNQGVGVSSVTVKVDETQKQSADMFSFDRGQSNAEDQGSSNNTQNQNQNSNEFSFDEEVDNVITTTNSETGATTENENLVSAGSYTGKVDYKV